MKRLLCIFTLVAIYFSSFGFVNAKQVDVAVEKEKGLSELVELLDDNDDNCILIWINDVDYDRIEEDALLETGIRRKDIADGLGIKAIQNYIQVKRSLSKKAYGKSNGEFYERVIKESGVKVVFQSQYSPVFILCGDKEQLIKIIKNADVRSVSLYDEPKCVAFSDVSSKNTGSEYIRDTSAIGADGEGVVIGLLETSHPKLSSQETEGYALFNLNKVSLADTSSSTDDHATSVAALMVGQPVTYNNVLYKGVAPEAELVCVSCGAFDDNYAGQSNHNIRAAIEKLLDEGVNVINSSIGFQKKPSVYDETVANMQTWMDHIAFNHDVHFVAAAGNVAVEDEGDYDGNGLKDETEYINALGMGYNVITVGNVQDNNALIGYSSPSTLSSQILNSNFCVAKCKEPFERFCSASYKTGIQYFYKPDIACYGTGIDYAYFEGLKGTSFSAPLITGMVAQLCSAYPALLTNNSKMKALLAATAVYRANDTHNYNSAVNTELFEYQGAGIANVLCAYNSYYAGKTLDLVLAGTTQQYSFNINVPSNYTYLRMAMSWIRKVNISGISHENANATNPDLANLDIKVYYNNVEVASSTNLGTNLEVLQFAVSQGGVYTVKIINNSYSNGANLGNQYISIAWY